MKPRSRRVPPVAAAMMLTAALVAVAPLAARACTIDNKPTAFANGARAVHWPVPKKWNQAVALTYTPFAFVGHFRVGAPVRFAEAKRELRFVLPAGSLRHAIQWRFGDGKRALGWSVAHRFTHPGVYRVYVDAYYTFLHHYYSFDLVRIVVTR